MNNAESLPPVPLSDTCERLCIYLWMKTLGQSQYPPPKSLRVRELNWSLYVYSDVFMSILYNVAHHPATGENANLHVQNYNFYLIQASKRWAFYSYLQEINVLKMKSEEWLREPSGEPSLLELSRGEASHRRSQWRMAAQTEWRNNVRRPKGKPMAAQTHAAVGSYLV